MPELPEVETVRISLIPSLVGQRVESVQFGSFIGVIGDLEPEQFRIDVTGRSVSELRRRGKYLLIDFDDGSGIIVHLRMTGALTMTSVEHDPLRFEHLSFSLANGQSLRFTDQRKFGRITWRSSANHDPLETKLGPEPLSDRFSTAYLGRVLKNRSAPIKALILDQRLIAGIGNIYADEALFRSRIHPQSPGGSLSTTQIASLVRSIKHVIRAGIENRGTSFSSYRDGNGESGSNQFSLQVYGRGRSDVPCVRCGGKLNVLTVGGRTSHYCPRCQPHPASGTGRLDASPEP